MSDSSAAGAEADVGGAAGKSNRGRCGRFPARPSRAHSWNPVGRHRRGFHGAPHASTAEFIQPCHALNSRIDSALKAPAVQNRGPATRAPPRFRLRLRMRRRAERIPPGP